MNRLGDPSFHVAFNRVMVIAWTIAVIPTLLWWRESVPWLVFMSLYANWVGHLSAYVAAKAEEKADK